MPIPHDEQERLLMAELEKCSHERAAAEDRILNPPYGRSVIEQREVLAARKLARENYNKAYAALVAHREFQRKNPSTNI
jgi:hypothetical protein